MATMKLTPKQPSRVPAATVGDVVVGWDIPAPTLLGWTMSNANPMDVMVGSQTIGMAAGYSAEVRGFPDDWEHPTRYDWEATFTKPNHPAIKLVGGQWLVTDGQTAAVRENDDVLEHYDLEAAPAPAPPA